MPYGIGRMSVASDAFVSEINATNWENGGGDWVTMTWISSGVIRPSSTGNNAAIRRQVGTYANDQYSSVTINKHLGTSGWVAAMVRMAAGTDESAYIGYAVSGGGGEYQIWRTDSNQNFTFLASTAIPAAEYPLAVGTVLTLEVEGTTLRLGSDASGVDEEKLTVVDATIASGMPGAHFWEDDDVTDVEISAWAGGDIGVAPVVTTVPTQQAALSDALPIAVTISSAANDIATVQFECDVAKGTVDVSDLAGTSVSAGTRGTDDFTLSGTHAQCVAVALLMTYTPIVDTGSDTTVTVTASNGTLSDAEVFEVECYYLLVEADTQPDLEATLATLTAQNAVAETQPFTLTAVDTGERTGEDTADVMTEAVAGAPVTLPTAAVESITVAAALLTKVVTLPLPAIASTSVVTALLAGLGGHAGEPSVSMRTRERTYALRSVAAA